MLRWNTNDVVDIVISILVGVILLIIFVVYETMLFVLKKITIFNNKLKQSYDKVFHSISKVQKRERQRKS
jgi:hypothetical protein